MEKFDPNRERKRLSDHYASITEGELQQLADNAWSLTDIAKELLKAEISNRGLPFEINDRHVVDDHTPPNLVTLREFRDLPDALLAKSILDSAEIECFLYDENTIRMDWLLSSFLGGVKLIVKEEDASDALAILNRQPQEAFELTGDDEYIQPRCPHCGSLNVLFGERGKRLAYLTIAAGVPLPVKRGGWKCESCGHIWDELDDPEVNLEENSR